MIINEYGDGLALYVFALILIPAVILGCIGKGIRFYGMVISVPVLYLLMGEHFKNFIVIVSGELLILWIYYKLHNVYKKNWVYYATLILLIFPIFECKVAGIFAFPSLAFLGISYFGFRMWQLVIEIHDGHLDNLNWFNVIYFVLFFPSLSSGPIDRYRRFSDEITDKLSGRLYFYEYFLPGCKKICIGVIYKFSLAEFINQFWLSKIPTVVTGISSIEYMYSYTLYLFFDFAGYSLMAIGTGYLLGVTLPENFNKPFLARNMKEFWDRWHISLSRWFGDYLFSRIVLNLLRGGVIKKQTTAVRFAYMVTMFTMGMWHGFTVYYLLYGLYQGVMLVLSDIYVKSKTYREHIKLPWYNTVSRIVCFHFIAFGMLIFSGYLFK